MNNDEIAGRILVLEAFTMATLGLYLANSRNDADYRKAGELLNYLKSVSASLAESTPPSVQQVVKTYSEHLAGLVSQNLRALHGESGQSH
jgi:hypothetical protein